MGNASIHKIAPVRELLTQNGVTVKFLPPYSPQFNLIENVFGYIKSKCNNFRPKVKKQEELLCHIDRAIAEFTSSRRISDWKLFLKMEKEFELCLEQSLGWN